METETWKTIIYQDKELNYEISNLGKIRHTIKKNILKTRIKKAYEYGDIYISPNQSKSMAVHRLVAIAFIPNPGNLPIVNHINRKRDDNKIGNLEWVTPQRNSKHSYENSDRIIPRQAIIQYTDATKTVVITQYESITDAAIKIGITTGTIYAILNGRKGSKQYFFEYVNKKVKIDTRFLLTNGFEPVKNHPNYLIHRDSSIFTIKRKIFLKQYHGSHDGYMQVRLNKVYYQVHRLVAIQFIPNPFTKKSVNHIDGTKINNHVTNLEWATHAENMQHAIDAKLNDIEKPVKQYTLEGEFIREYKSMTDACRTLNLPRSSINAISNCCRGIHKYAHGYIWKFLNDTSPVIPFQINAVKQYTLNGKFLQLFDSPTHALIYLGKRKDSTSQITNCCKGVTKFAFNYIWRFAHDDTIVLPINNPRRQNIKIDQYDLNDNYITTHTSYAAAVLSIPGSTYYLIKKCATGGCEQAYDYKWKCKPIRV